MKARWWIGGGVLVVLLLVVVFGVFLTTSASYGPEAPAAVRPPAATATAPAANGPAPAPPESFEEEQAEGKAHLKAYAWDLDDAGEMDMPAEAPPEDQKAVERRRPAKKKSGKLAVDSAPPGGQVLAMLGADETSLDGVFEGASPFSQRGAFDLPQGAPDADVTVEDDEETRPRSQLLGGLGEQVDADGERDRIERSKSGLENERKPARPAKPKAPPPPLQVGRLELPAVVPYDPEAGEPATTLPNMAYFENTYLGGNAAHVELLRRAGRIWRRIGLPPQPFDGPEDAGLALSVAVDRTHVDRPSRVLLQVGLEGSGRAGWRRPPLDVVVVLDASAVRTPRVAVRIIGALIERLGPADRVAVRRVGDAAPIVPLTGPDAARRTLTDDPRALLDGARRGTLAAGLAAAGRDLEAAADTARIPGTGVVLTVLGPGVAAPPPTVRRAAHALTTAGVTVSVLETAAGDPIGTVTRSAWWRVAHAGHGGHHRVSDGDALVAAVDAELDRLSRVVARLVRVNIRLAPGVKAVRVLGSRLLDAAEVKRVKAREKAVDDRLSRTMGVSADRGDDDDGLQTVIPYFLGDDTHVILVELWVERAGPIADVSLRYKDMVRLDNGRAAGHVSLGSLPRPAGPIEIGVLQNARGVAFAEALGNAARVAEAGSSSSRWLDYARGLASDPADVALAERLARFTRRTGGARAARALEIAARRRLGVGHALAGR